MCLRPQFLYQLSFNPSLFLGFQKWDGYFARVKQRRGTATLFHVSRVKGVFPSVRGVLGTALIQLGTVFFFLDRIYLYLTYMTQTTEINV